MESGRVRRTLGIKGNDRCVFVGTTGSGKTTLAKALLWDLPNVAVLDPKRTFRLPTEWPYGFRVSEKRSEIERHDSEQTIIYRPNETEVTDGGNSIQWWFWWLYNRRNTIGYVDELTMVSNRTIPGRGHAACIQLGRERGVGLWSATQRPVNVPRIALSESEHMFIFRLRHPDDRDTMADLSDPRVGSRSPRNNEFWYYNDRAQIVRLYGKANVGPVLA